MAETLTQSQILDRIKNDVVYAIGFGLDNNPDGMLQVMNMQGISSQNVAEAYEKLKALYYGGDKQKLLNIFARVPYLNNQSSADGAYTAGFSEYFVSTSKPDQIQTAKAVNPNAKFDFNAVLAGLGAGLTGFAGYQAPQTGTAPGNAMTAQQQAAAQAAAAAEAKKKRVRTYWIIGSVVGVVVVGVILYFVFRKKPKAQS